MFRNSRSVHTQTAALVFALLLLPAPAAGPPDGRAAAAHPFSIDIDNFGQVNPNHYRGGEPDEDDYSPLAALGIKTVIDLRSEDVDPDEKGLAEAVGMKYVRIPMTTRETPSTVKVQQFLQIVNDPANQPVFVHCVGGRHRTGVMTAVYRITRYGWTADRAFKEMKEYHFGPAFLHPEFKNFVYRYESTHSAAALAGAAR